MSRAVPLLGLLGIAACKPTEVEVDLLLEELTCDGLYDPAVADPMVIDTTEQLRAALAKQAPTAHMIAYADLLEQRAATLLEQIAAEGSEGCLTLGEYPTGGVALDAACDAAIYGVTLDGDLDWSVASEGDYESWAWTWMRYEEDGRSLELNGTLAYSAAGDSVSVAADLSWAALIDGETDGSYVLSSSGDLHSVYKGSLIVLDAPRAPVGQLCFGSQASYDDGHQAWTWRTLVQADKLWEIQDGWDARGAACQTISVDGVIFEDDCG